MLALLRANLPTILIIAGLLLFFGLLVYSLIRDKKKGKSSCCGGCAGCAMACPNRIKKIQGQSEQPPHPNTGDVES